MRHSKIAAEYQRLVKNAVDDAKEQISAVHANDVWNMAAKDVWNMVAKESYLILGMYMVTRSMVSEFEVDFVNRVYENARGEILAHAAQCVGEIS